MKQTHKLSPSVIHYVLMGVIGKEVHIVVDELEK